MLKYNIVIILEKGRADIRISVIIPTLNAAPYLSKLLISLQNQSIKPYEIIVVDSTSEDDSAEIARRMGTQVLTVTRGSFDHGRTRNYAASHAIGEVLVFITQDALPSDNRFLENLVQPFDDIDVAAVCGRQVALPDARILERMNIEFNYPLEPMRRSLADVKIYGIKTFFFTNVCSAVRKEVFDKVGGFPAPIVSNEDMILAARCVLSGHSIAYAPEARVDHSHQYTLKQLFNRYFDIGGSLRMNNWLLSYAKAEGEGMRLIKAQFRQLRKPKMWRWIPRWFAESTVKFTGYRMGLVYHAIPQKIRRKCSMHPLFWDQVESTKSI
ncbi:glycosyltransferase family 2 protein [Cohnella suwonensis]|uniref:Glycosyltransferase family 2 protein n=1 Tax=Cohnella suwonensis TaxID=696072 RepID=A0ABW0LXK2_9BACL